MRVVGGILGLVLVLAIILFVYKSQFTQGPAGSAPPMQTIDVTGVKTELIALGQAERLYLASHGSYASIDQLQQEGSTTLSNGSSRGYSYVADVDDGQHFKITATSSDPAKKNWPTLVIDETMQVSQQ